MLQPDLQFGIGIPTFWEENQVMKTNTFVLFKRTASDERNFWLGRQCTGAVKFCLWSDSFGVGGEGDCKVEIEVTK